MARALAHSVRREQEARDLLIATRARLADRDALFGTLEAELWQDFEKSARQSAARIDRLERELEEATVALAGHQTQVTVIKGLEATVAAQNKRIVELDLRLSRLLVSAPMRLVQRLRALPLARTIFARRARDYETELSRRLRS